MNRYWIQGPLWALVAVAMAALALPALAQNQAGLETAAEAAGEGT